VVMLTHESQCLQTNRAITESSALCTTCYDTNMLSHILLFQRYGVATAIDKSELKISSNTFQLTITLLLPNRDIFARLHNNNRVSQMNARLFALQFNKLFGAPVRLIYAT
jgi:hypothetical protein